MLPFDWSFPYPSQRMPLLASNVVSTSQPLAAQAGLRMLYAGGNAIDSAIATAIALTVVEPTQNGIGGDLFALVWHEGELLGLNASGRGGGGGAPPPPPPRAGVAHTRGGGGSLARARGRGG
ncbi:gamma-glutamyltransferase, partial [Cupriavidus sp. AU9028]|uniref:gamma-glutamyltransferase n=1 Tax=Cupriavidus sp. AU9028 TaxID=2871157 RepID=UPI001C956C55